MHSHNELRQRNRQLRAALDSDAREQAGKRLFERISVMDEFLQAERIATYFAVNGEIDLTAIIDFALACGKQVYLPNLDRQSLRFSPYFHDQKMRINKFKLPEPDVGDDEMIEPDQLNLVLAPLVVFDADGNRIGMGGGFYDRSFAFRKNPDCSLPLLIGVAHELQRVDSILPEDWDVPLDRVVTDQASYP
ncbi:MAG: 5-formyltetrahydrofolate cyclo-ligase [Planctomycetota bacterium]|jgi:5-formyltetrahydrofolate cyclo-ligase